MTAIPDTLTDFDFLELVAFDSKTESDGWTYAYENYGPRFEFNNYTAVDAADLRNLHRREKAAIDRWWAEHRDDGCSLHNAHVREADRRRDDQYLWAFRHENGNVSGSETEEHARWFCLNDSWRATAILRRDTPGGEWTVAEDFTGCEADSGVGWVQVGDSILVDGAWLTVTESGTEVLDMRAQGGSARYHHRFFMLSDGQRLDPPPYWETQPTVRIRRRISIPEGVAA